MTIYLVIHADQFHEVFHPHSSLHCCLPIANLKGIREYGVLHKDTLTVEGVADGQAGPGALELGPHKEAR